VSLKIAFVSSFSFSLRRDGYIFGDMELFLVQNDRMTQENEVPILHCRPGHGVHSPTSSIEYIYIYRRKER